MKKLLLSLGTVAAIAAPVASVIACGHTATPKDTKTDFQKSDFGKVVSKNIIDGEMGQIPAASLEQFEKEVSTLVLVATTRDKDLTDYKGQDAKEIAQLTTEKAKRGIQHFYYFKKTKGIATPLLDSLKNPNGTVTKTAEDSLAAPSAYLIEKGTTQDIETADFFVGINDKTVDKTSVLASFQKLSVVGNKLNVESVVAWTKSSPAKTQGTTTITAGVSGNTLKTGLTTTELASLDVSLMDDAASAASILKIPAANVPNELTQGNTLSYDPATKTITISTNVSGDKHIVLQAK